MIRDCTPHGPLSNRLALLRSRSSPYLPLQDGDGIGQEMAAKRFCHDGGSSRSASSSRLIGEAERAFMVRAVVVATATRAILPFLAGVHFVHSGVGIPPPNSPYEASRRREYSSGRLCNSDRSLGPLPGFLPLLENRLRDKQLRYVLSRLFFLSTSGICRWIDCAGDDGPLPCSPGCISALAIQSASCAY